MTRDSVMVNSGIIALTVWAYDTIWHNTFEVNT